MRRSFSIQIRLSQLLYYVTSEVFVETSFHAPLQCSYYFYCKIFAFAIGK